jgi:oligopeptide transport system substrate-binding protein
LRFLLVTLLLFVSPLLHAGIWNNPHAGPLTQNTGYSAFVTPPKTLDPAKSFSSDEIQFIAQIYEPPLQYAYLKRPFELIPLTAEKMPVVTFLDKEGQALPADAPPHKVASTVYDIYIKPGIYYANHPAFAQNAEGRALYLQLNEKNLQQIKSLDDFKKTGTRELIADDYVYQIKRLADPKNHSPIFGIMSDYIIGFSAFNQSLQKKPSDLRLVSIAGVKTISRYHYQIKIKGMYPQFIYWLAMSFFSPVPWEVEAFYQQKGMEEKNLSLKWLPLGTGPYRLTKNDPNREMILERNPNFHAEYYPSEGSKENEAEGYLENAGKRLPFVDKFIFSLDKESIPRWNKFLQGYYDRSGISEDNFQQSIKLDEKGNAELTPMLKEKGIRLQTAVLPGIYYLGFNMQNDVVGGYSIKKQKLRQAISIAFDDQEYISIFLNGRGIPAQGPIPPGIFGYQSQNINPYVYRMEQGKLKRRSISEAKKLFAEAGYPHGIDPQTGKALILNYDAATTGTPDDKARLEWMRKQFAKLGIHLNIRNTDYNRFQEKVRAGTVQIFSWGWSADYPDPEDFLFLLYGPNAKIKHGGENAANYNNPRVNQLFDEIKVLPNNADRQEKINELLKIVRQDAPWIWGFYPISFVVSNQWVYPIKLHAVANNTLKYEKLDFDLRARLIKQWNHPALLPIIFILLAVLVMLIPLVFVYWKREHQPNVKRKNF